jgi:hypothetical protein
MRIIARPPDPASAAPQSRQFDFERLVDLRGIEPLTS